jgi:hypothetical protein
MYNAVQPVSNLCDLIKIDNSEGDIPEQSEYNNLVLLKSHKMYRF